MHAADDKATFDEVLEIINKCWRNENVEEELQKAFKVFDRTGGGHVNKDEFRVEMLNRGEKLNEQEVEDLINLALQNDYEININCKFIY